MSASVRPRKTGLIVFASRIVSVFTGLLFLVMMTRWLTPSQFGLWEFIIDVVAFAAYPTGIITYWATREVARGKPVARTALLTSQLTSVLGVGVYLLLAFLSYREVGSALGPFLLSIALVPLAYWTQSAASLVSGYDPAISGYSLFLSEPAKLIVAYPLLFVFRAGIYGVITAIAVSYLVQGLYATYRLRPASTDKFSLSLGVGWLKDWHVPTLVTASYILSIADTFAASVGQGGTSLAGYYQAAFQIATIVSYATYLSVALYPLMLRNATEKLPGEVLEFALLFAMPMAAGAIAIAPKILYLLKPEYVASSPALVVLSFAAVASLVIGGHGPVADGSRKGGPGAGRQEKENSRQRPLLCVGCKRRVYECIRRYRLLPRLLWNSGRNLRSQSRPLLVGRSARHVVGASRSQDDEAQVQDTVHRFSLGRCVRRQRHPDGSCRLSRWGPASDERARRAGIRS